MYRQSPSRNLRSKRIRVKHVLQICLLLAVCFWLIYQVKHSHDKKKEFDESEANSLLKENIDEVIKLGRKDIHSRPDETITKHEEPIEEEETNEDDDVEENKHEEVEREKPDEGVDREEDIVDDDDKEREDSDENETRETDNEDNGHAQMEKEISEEDNDHDGDDKSAHEAREEHYKADDASSAVTHDAQIETTENENEHVENSNERSENDLEEEKTEDDDEETNKGEDRKDVEAEMAKGYNGNLTTGMFDNSENGSSLNNIVPEGYNGNLTSNESTEVNLENGGISFENVTAIQPELDRGEGRIMEGISGNSTSNVDNNNRIGSNSTVSPENKDVIYEEVSNSSNNTESSELENKNNEIEAEKQDTHDGKDEILETTMTENPEEVERDSIDISDVRVDLDTLPEIQTEGTDSDDMAAE